MAIIVDNDTKLVVQGATGREGSFHTLRNRDYGTDVVAGVTPGKGGQDLDGIPIFNTVAEAVEEAGANTSMVFGRAPGARVPGPVGGPDAEVTDQPPSRRSPGEPVRDSALGRPQRAAKPLPQ